ncbi:ABC transporter ATP-binding protein [Alkalibacillus aidingensis]|uniref:ABC transporter ATP-binding protein n=1 Tax=Alkalibacillus aidingensis TaxID=2747607 RepID=UPI0016609853|nr:energy-coupling factor transporter ATPase [Alkalibacillus aidingensis]
MIKQCNSSKLEPLIRVENLSFDYDNLKNPLISDISFSIDHGETVLLMGGSGSGKSTISLCLNGLYPDAVEGFSSGEIYFKGKQTTEFNKGELNQQIGVVFQDPESQFCMITVEDELAFTLENLKTPREEIGLRITKVLEEVGLSDYRNHKIHELSGGQKQKVALASALIQQPSLLILDEPTANLDPVSSIEFITLIRRLKEQHHIAVLIIEHQADDWLALINRVLVLGKNGDIIANGTSEQVFNDQRERLIQEGIFIPKVFMKAKKYITKSCEEISSSTKPCLTVKDLTFKRKGDVILNKVNLSLYEGEFVAITGENGAGKSTLLQLMSGILKPSQGKIEFLGQSFTKWKEQQLRKQMGFVFQNPEHQFITDTVFDEVAFGMTLNNYGEELTSQRTNDLLKHFQLSELKWRNPFSLSGGQKRRLSVATMLDETPDLLLFDEPTFGQDAQTTEELMFFIKHLQEQGTTIVFVTHDMDLVDTYCERVFVLNNQKIKFEGSPSELWEQTQTLKEARLRLPYRIRHQKKAGEPYDFVY